MTSSTLVRGLVMSLVVAMGAQQAFGQAAQAVRQAPRAASAITSGQLARVAQNRPAFEALVRNVERYDRGLAAQLRTVGTNTSAAAAFTSIAQRLNSNSQIQAAIGPALAQVTSGSGVVSAEALNAAITAARATVIQNTTVSESAQVVANAANDNRTATVSAQDETKISALEQALTAKGVSSATVAGMGVAVRAITAATGENPIGEDATDCVSTKFQSQGAIENVAKLLASVRGATTLEAARANMARFVNDNKLGSGEADEVLAAVSGQKPEVAQCNIVSQKYANAK